MVSTNDSLRWFLSNDAAGSSATLWTPSESNRGFTQMRSGVRGAAPPLAGSVARPRKVRSRGQRCEIEVFMWLPSFCTNCSGVARAPTVRRTRGGAQKAGPGDSLTSDRRLAYAAQVLTEHPG